MHHGEGVITARSRCRWTTVVVRQFSFIATSLSHPPAGIRSGVERAALRIPSPTGLIVWPDFFSVVWLLSELMVCAPGPVLYHSPPGGDRCTRMVRFPRFPFPCRQKEGSAGESVPGIPSLRTGSVTSGTSAGRSLIVLRDPHSDQEVSCEQHI